MMKKVMFFFFVCFMILLSILCNILYKRNVLSGEMALFLTFINGVIFFGGCSIWEKHHQ